MRNSAGLRSLQKHYVDRKDVVFLTLFQREPHTGQMAYKDIDPSRSYRDRLELAERSKKKLQLTGPILVDSMQDKARKLFAGLPNPMIVIDAKGRVVSKAPWAEAKVVEAALAGTVSKVVEPATWSNPPRWSTQKRAAASKAEPSRQR